MLIESKVPNAPSTPTAEHPSASTSSLLLEHKLNEAFLTSDFPLEVNAIQGGKFSVRELAHEIIVNPAFKLSSNTNTTSQTVREIATRAFFNDFKARMESGKADAMLLELLVDVRSRISKLLPTSSHFHTKFLSEFDIDLLRQQIELNSFDPNEWITYISNTMKAMCSPARDELVSNILNASDPFKAFQSIFEVLDLMLIDHLNHQILTIRPALIAQAVEYETFKFNTLLDSGEIQLNHTTSWLTAAVQAARDHIETRNPESISPAWPTFETLLSDAFLSLVCSNTLISFENCPETLTLDVKRLFDIQDELQRIAVTAALIMICKNIARERFVSDSQAQVDLKDGLLAILSDGSTTLNDISLFLIGRLSHETHKLPLDQQEFLTNMIRKTISYRDSLYLVLSRRLHRILRQLLISGEENPIINSSTLASLGLGVVAEEVASVGSRLAYLVHYNRQVYAAHYSSILKRAIAAYSE
ncbi:hypothetical protein DSO57_1031733 [Entomophthora muscae]|uniref:Uncharacterized protein n=1 Tax=Entomophthora muscae TaxID=34485 RepID=A0ACC2TZ07_9FUNG|nr:hypothetical protein DSO57_1031733 [Entomophthora muscae]